MTNVFVPLTPSHKRSWCHSLRRRSPRHLPGTETVMSSKLTACCTPLRQAPNACPAAVRRGATRSLSRRLRRPVVPSRRAYPHPRRSAGEIKRRDLLFGELTCEAHVPHRGFDRGVTHDFFEAIGIEPGLRCQSRERSPTEVVEVAASKATGITCVV